MVKIIKPELTTTERNVIHSSLMDTLQLLSVQEPTKIHKTIYTVLKKLNQ